jgi:hypothetical protein
MEPNNIDQQFREKLNARTIKPSENSWDRLDAMLTVADPSVSEPAKHKPKRNFRWMYVAASVLGFICIATVFLSQTEEMIDNERQSVVFEQQKVESSDTVLKEVLEVPSNRSEAEVVANPEIDVNKKPSTEKILLRNIQTASKKPAVETATAFTEKSNGTKAATSNETIQKAELNTDIKVNAAALLASVEPRKTTQPKLLNAKVVKVNTSELLSQVDNELELSFREKVIQSVNKKYKEVKVAVTNRNLQ